MPYRMGRGDYYQGDYYRGGFLGSIGKGLLSIGEMIPGVGTGIKVARGIGSLMSAGGSSGATQPIGSAPPPYVPMNIAPPMGLMPGKTPVVKGALPPAGYTPTPRKVKGIGGAISRMLPGGATGYEYVRRRQMRVTNVKALRRAIRRATGFAKLAMKCIKIVNPRKKGTFGGWKKGRKR